MGKTNKQNREITKNILLVGERGVGKTALWDCLYYPSHSFNPNYNKTDEPLRRKAIKESVDGNIISWIHDVPGDLGTFKKSANAEYLQQFDTIIFCFNINDRRTFEKIEDWRLHVENNHTNLNNLQLILVATKTDYKPTTSNKTVTYTVEGEAKEYAFDNSMTYFETSAQQKRGIEAVYNQMNEEPKPQLSSSSAEKSKKTHYTAEVLVPSSTAATGVGLVVAGFVGLITLNPVIAIAAGLGAGLISAFLMSALGTAIQECRARFFAPQSASTIKPFNLQESNDADFTI
ncbi:MAG: hypothetical protein K2Q14_01145 [Gammaproteobacteria bacterium]|nr:hypothetical protein [Gammaproteobacteria bacterium]